MFREDLKTVADVQNHIREQWQWYEYQKDMGMTTEQAIDQAYAVGQGIISVLTQNAYDEVFTDEFRAEWESWRAMMMFGEE